MFIIIDDSFSYISRNHWHTCFFELLCGSTAKCISCIKRSIMLIVYGRWVSGFIVFCMTIVAISLNWLDNCDSRSFPATCSSPFSKIWQRRSSTIVNYLQQNYFAHFRTIDDDWNIKWLDMGYYKPPNKFFHDQSFHHRHIRPARKLFLNP